MYASISMFSQTLTVLLDIATKFNLIAPIAEQCEHQYVSCPHHRAKPGLDSHSLLHRERPEREYA